ncbi:MAG: dihydroorotate dehydrogenase [Candidatus Muirbacterium halophilum]|nr:dihydroorotate dehydrogenase [Candidatus Muirbacterium halophilum]MCK9476908.1 dihydroorotate dehydrogenase [Candidatus Muirbacterium halophilum]
MKNVFGKEICFSPEIKGIKFKNPILTASGTCGFGVELKDFFELSSIGGIVLKGTTLLPKDGNECPRIAEFNGGIVNSIGLQNPGINGFINDISPKLYNCNTNIITNISGNTIDEYQQMCEIIENEKVIDCIEINISCPNVKMGGISFGTDSNTVFELVSNCRAITSKPLIVKLTPNITDITKIALSAQKAGADAVTCINTFKGLLFDIEKNDFSLKNIVGGVSGPAIKPMALFAVYECAKVLDIPIIGVGGIMNFNDALEFLKVGASAVQIGTATFKDPANPAIIARLIEREWGKYD